MSVTIHPTNTYNVQASLVQFWIDELGALYDASPPAYFASKPATLINWPDIQMSMPCYSFYHLMASSLSDSYQGRVVSDTEAGVKAVGSLAIDMWVNREDTQNGREVWQARLEWMSAAVQMVYTRTKSIAVFDYLNAPEVPKPTNYLVRMKDMNSIQRARDDNPAVERRAIIVNYGWTLRA